MSLFEDYPCVGVCQDDPETGYCIGCGRPPMPGYGPATPAPGSGADSPAAPTETPQDPPSAPVR